MPDVSHSGPEIRLRAVEPEDADLMFDVENDEAAWSTSDTIAPYSHHSLREYALHYNSDPFAAGQLRLIAILDDNTPIGIVDLYEISPVHSHCWMGIYILPKFRGLGMGRISIEKCICYIRKYLPLRSIGVRILASNTASTRIFEDTGFKYAGCLPQWRFYNGIFQDMLLYVRKIEN